MAQSEKTAELLAEKAKIVEEASVLSEKALKAESEMQQER